MQASSPKWFPWRSLSTYSESHTAPAPPYTTRSGHSRGGKMEDGALQEADREQ